MIKIIVVFLALLLCLSGCIGNDYTEPENRTLITALVIENRDEFLVTAEIINAQSDSFVKADSKDYLTGKGSDIEEALKEIKNNYSKEISLYHCPLIICEKSLLKNKYEKIYDFILNNPQISLAANLLILESDLNFSQIAQESKDLIGYKISEQIELKGLETKIIDIVRNKTTPARLDFVDEEVLVVKND